MLRARQRTSLLSGFASTTRRKRPGSSPRLSAMSAETGQRDEPLRAVFIRLELFKPGQRRLGIRHPLKQMSCCGLNQMRLAPLGVAFDLKNLVPFIQADIGTCDVVVARKQLGKLLQLRQQQGDLRQVAFGRLGVAGHEIVSILVYTELRFKHRWGIAREQLSEFKILLGLKN